MSLHLNGLTLSIAQMGPGFLILDQPVDHAPSDAHVVLSVDGREQRWAVRLPEGIRAAQKRVIGAKL